jgi:uncharacterized membrane protein SpoIIM required for sporulation
VNTIGAYAARVDLDAYVAERRGEWTRLEKLTAKRKLAPREAEELVLLYQRAATHLSVVRSRSADPLLIAALSQLVIAARAAITGGRRFSWTPVVRFFTSAYPSELYRTRWWWTGVGLLSILATGLLMLYIVANPQVPQSVLGSGLSRFVDTEFVSYYSEFHAQNFAAQVWTNNALLTAQCLAAGVLVLPVIYLLGANLLNLGLIGGVMVGAGRGDVFFAYILPHGLLELTCVFVGAGVGLRIAWGWIAPGPHQTRGHALAARARSGMLVALGLAVTLGVAGLLEAYVTPAPLPAFVRIGIGAVVWLAFLAYVWIVGKDAHLRGETADLDPEHREAEVPTV